MAGCASEPPPAAPPAPKPITIPCPHGRVWTKAEKNALANALEPIPAASIIWTMEFDWQSLVDQSKACTDAQK
jgi:hypothetical protein